MFEDVGLNVRRLPSTATPVRVGWRHPCSVPDDHKDVFIAIDQPGQSLNELNTGIAFAKRTKAEDQRRLLTLSRFIHGE